MYSGEPKKVSETLTCLMGYKGFYPWMTTYVPLVTPCGPQVDRLEFFS